jgi:hypothetical protein
VDDLAERRVVRDREDREGALVRDLDQRGRHVLEAEPDAEAERGHAGVLERRHERALRLRVPAQPHAGRQHHPLAREPARGLVDLYRVRAHDLALRALRPAADQRQAERLLGEHVAEAEAGSGRLSHDGRASLCAVRRRSQTARASLGVRRLPGAGERPKTWTPHEPRRHA